MRTSIIYDWPQSQLCMCCVHVSQEILDDSAKMCGIGCTESDGVYCSGFEENMEDEDE